MDVNLRIAFLVAATLLLSACATEAKYGKKLDTWVGSNEIDLVRAWGPPQQSYESGGSKFLTYSNSRQAFIPGTPATATTNIYGNTAFTNINPGMAAQSFDLSCATTFEVQNLKIVKWTWRGNDCTSD